MIDESQPIEGGPSENPSAVADGGAGNDPAVVRKRGRPRTDRKTKQVTMRLDENIFEFYKEKARSNGEPMSQTIIQALMEWKIGWEEIGKAHEQLTRFIKQTDGIMGLIK